MTRVRGDWLTAEPTQAVLRLLSSGGHRALVVGGCVRNALLGQPVADVDMATDALPERVMALAEKARMRAVPTGIDHGTVTLVLEGTGIEVTTFRKDVDTDGRRAVVRFSTDIRDDALRRDFTMNALYAEADGTLVDPLGGLPDLLARRVVFIEDAARRIEEDYLRILRFFRFNAWYGDPEAGFDPDALAAIADALDGLDRLSRERVGAEMLRLLAAPFPAICVSVMARIGVLTRLLPGADASALAPLEAAEAQLALAPSPIRRLAALGDIPVDRLRLSKQDARRFALYRSLIGSTDPPSAVAYRHDAEIARDVIALRAALLGAPVPAIGDAALAEAAAARFPISAGDLMPAYQGARLGARLEALEQRWIASDFTLDRAALLALPDDA